MRNRTSDLFFGKAIVRIALSWCDICIHGLHLSLFLNLLESSFPTSFVLNIYRHQSSNLFHLHSPLVWLFLSCLPRLIRRKKSQKVYKLRFSLLSFHLSFFLNKWNWNKKSEKKVQKWTERPDIQDQVRLLVVNLHPGWSLSCCCQSQSLQRNVRNSTECEKDPIWRTDLVNLILTDRSQVFRSPVSQLTMSLLSTALDRNMKWQDFYSQYCSFSSHQNNMFILREDHLSQSDDSHRQGGVVSVTLM